MVDKEEGYKGQKKIERAKEICSRKERIHGADEWFTLRSTYDHTHIICTSSECTNVYTWAYMGSEAEKSGRCTGGMHRYGGQCSFIPGVHGNLLVFTGGMHPPFPSSLIVHGPRPSLRGDQCKRRYELITLVHDSIGTKNDDGWFSGCDDTTSTRHGATASEDKWHVRTWCICMQCGSGRDREKRVTKRVTKRAGAAKEA